jgi:hypothetical protein
VGVLAVADQTHRFLDLSWVKPACSASISTFGMIASVCMLLAQPLLPR